MLDDADRRLGELAVEAGHFGPRELARALRDSRDKGRPLAETLVDMNLLTADQARVLVGGRSSPEPPRVLQRMRSAWDRMSAHARVWLLVIALLVTLFALSVPLSLLRR